MFLLRYVIWLLTRAIVSLRYRVHIQGIEQVRGLKGPVLVLPNHPAYTDPILVLVALWPSLRPRPLQYEGYFRNPLLYPLMKLIGALPVPDLERASVQARERTAQTLAAVIEGLTQGQCFVLWPAGHIEYDGMEHLGGTRAASDVLQAVPGAELVLVRSRGLWGSMFSFAPTGKKPRLIRNLWRGLALLLSNLLVFMPRRPVNMIVEHVGRDRLPEPRREVLNPWLEKWYNRDGPETPSFIPHHFLFGRRTYEFPARPGSTEVDLSGIKPETRTAVALVLAHKLKRPLTDDEQKPATALDQLGLDSLDRMEVTLAVEQQFGFHGDEVPAALGQLWALAEGLVERAPPKPPPSDWFRPLSDEGALTILGETIPEAFAARALANPRDIVVADDLAGTLTYERLLVGTLTLSRRLATLPGANVGLMLPAAVACDMAFLGLHFAGKLPVLLNWTTGPANLAHAARVMSLTHVVTSRAFIDRSGVTVEGVEYLFLEDLRQQIGRLELLRTLLAVRLLPGRIRKRVPRVEAQQPAMVLFTSGSERAPKAVPLTHANIMCELRAGIPFLGLTRAESLLGFLPAFHSFGIVATILLPVLGGARVVYHPDPTDASGLARKIAGYRPSLLLGTPTFIGYIVDRSRPGELTSLRLIIIGAEKPPSSLWERCARVAPQAALVEGYGITECSLVVAINRPEANRQGTLGQPLPGVAVRVVDLETEHELPANRTGMLWVSGPTVFPGYLGYDVPSPFREQDGKRWYVTGDLAEIDADGFIRLAGRLKRFLKAGGEMISLPALEEPFSRLYPPTDKGPRVAVEGVETESGRRIVLFTTEKFTVAEANALLLKEGIRGVMRLDEVRRLGTIPLLGTGKVDYKVLRAEIAGEKEKAASAK